MPFQLQPAVASDARAFTSIVFEAFHPDDPFECAIYPFGATPKAVEHEYKAILKLFDDPNVAYMKLVDTDIPHDQNGTEIVAFARWKIWKHERPKEVWDVLWGPGRADMNNAVDGILDDVDVVVERAFYENGQRMRRQHIQGMPCVYMSMLCTRPTARRRGAARMLLNWGLELADREGLAIFALVSPMIMSFEEANRVGFEVVDSWTLDVKDLGTRRTNVSKWPAKKTFVKRPPSSRISASG